ncbi:hypothetical protein ACFLW8_04455, partial [Chloroflexota bacterium]
GQDGAGSVQQTADGGYIIVGSTMSFGAGNGNGDVYLVKTDSSGNEAWSKTFGGSDSEGGSSVWQTSDGGYIIVGGVTIEQSGFIVSGDIYLVRTDSSGNEVWSQTFGSTGLDGGASVQQTADGSYIITGHYGIAPPHGHSDVYLVKVRR